MISIRQIVKEYKGRRDSFSSENLLEFLCEAFRRGNLLEEGTAGYPEAAFRYHFT